MNDFEYTIEPFMIDETRRLSATIAKKAIVTIEGIEYEYPITKTVIRDGFFKHYIEVEDEPVGSVEKAVLLNENDIPLITGKGIIEKGNDGYQFAFKAFILVSEEEPPETPII